ncbi:MULTISPECIES: PepSY domain-containing protein [Streptomyces]|uniref:PepSY domain-containing protein n=1 Tax=Streptomyces lonegramiae TaxID=3075524 RepID=A0ABU2XPN1_9ACTN|nr:PepSY domain-containing protein [Streptomyces sp. DSM 41529]MDT0547409.1 PepSY domain-containing protein [Streptomyces sp. DSM 41529]
MKRMPIIAALAAASLATASALTVATATAAPRPSTTSKSTSLVQAAEAAVKAVPGTVASVERDDDRPGWEVEVLGKDNAWHEVKVGANGQVLGQKLDKDEDDRKEATVLRTAKVGAVAAAERVKGTVTSVELDDKVWEVELAGKFREVNVNPQTGAVTQSHEDDHHEGDHHGNDHHEDED